MNKLIISFCSNILSQLFSKKVEIIKAIPVGGGCINNAVCLKTTSGDFFLKWNLNCHQDMFIKEAEGLNEMRKAKTASLVIPEVIYAGEKNENPGLIILEYLPTSTLVKNFDEKLGRGIARLHEFKAEKFGFYSSNYCGLTKQINNWNENWPDFFAYSRLNYLIGLLKNKNQLSVEEIKIYEKLVQKTSTILNHKTYPSLIHGDLWSGNYMYTSQGPALIDPATYYADREMELGMMQLFGGFNPKVWAAYNEYLPLESGWKERIKLYQLYHVLNHFVLFGGSYGQQALSIAKYFTA